jgi:predicted amino acid racemase
MMASGAVALADTRDANLRRLREALPGVELHRIYLPSLGAAFEPGDVTYISSSRAAAALASLPGAADAKRRLMIQVETGDLRDGVPEDGLFDLARAVVENPGLELLGISTNYACFDGARSGVADSINAVANAAKDLRKRGIRVDRVSGGNSSLLWLVQQGVRLPVEITELRCGEALLLGQDALCHEPLPGCRQDACVLRAEVLEMYTKPVLGGRRCRLVLGLGRQDLGSGPVRFVNQDLVEVGRSSDYMVVDLSGPRRDVGLGEFIEMIPSYDALVAAWTSPFVDRRIR